MTEASDRRIRIGDREVLARAWQTLTRYTVEVERRDGRTETVIRDVEDHGNSAAVLPYDPERGTVLLTSQFRMAAHLSGHEGWLIEACAGMIDRGETAEQAAIREAREELGVMLRALRRIVGVFVSPGSSQEHATLFSARYAPADRTSAGGGVDDGEDIEVIEMPLGEAARAVADGTIVDAKTILLIQALLLDRRDGAPD